MNKYYQDILDKLDIKKNDFLFISSDITKLIIDFNKKKIKFEPNKFIDAIINRIGDGGTLIFPTYNWDFCKGVDFNYLKSPSKTGALSKIALSRSDFIRTHNPIYSFAVKGNYSKDILSLGHKSCFGKDSPFAFFANKNAKNIFIGIDYKLGFTMDHYAEELAGVDYRFFKKFSGNYIDKNNRIKKVTYKMYVRNLSLNVVTGISNNLDKEFIKNKCMIKIKIFSTNYTIINLKKASDIMIRSIRQKKGFIYPKSI